jgi:filamentous hemagglutinin family protein
VNLCLLDSITKNIGDGTKIDLTGSLQGQGNHETLYILNWNGLSPGTASIELPNAANNDYKGVVYTFKGKVILV